MAKMVQIDGGKLAQIIKARQLKNAHVSRELGFNDAYIKHCTERNTISTGAQKMLATMFGIMPNDYEYTEPEPMEEVKPEPEPEQMEITEPHEEEQKPVTGPVATLDVGELQKAVALALGNMHTDYDSLRGAIREGILDALYQAINDSDMRNALMGLPTNAHLSALQLNLKRAYTNVKGGK